MTANAAGPWIPPELARLFLVLVMLLLVVVPRKSRCVPTRGAGVPLGPSVVDPSEAAPGTDGRGSTTLETFESDQRAVDGSHPTLDPANL